MAETFGKELLIRIKKRYTYQVRFADEMNVSESSVAQWISGKAYPSTENLAKICELLSWDPKEAENMMEKEKRQKALRKYNAEPDALENVLITFCNLPLSQQGILLKELTEAYYMRKLREGERGQYFDIDIPNDISSKKRSFYNGEQPVE